MKSLVLDAFTRIAPAHWQNNKVNTTSHNAAYLAPRVESAEIVVYYYNKTEGIEKSRKAC